MFDREVMDSALAELPAKVTMVQQELDRLDKQIRQAAAERCSLQEQHEQASAVSAQAAGQITACLQNISNLNGRQRDLQMLQQLRQQRGTEQRAAIAQLQVEICSRPCMGLLDLTAA